jgi:hypothetical protein
VGYRIRSRHVSRGFFAVSIRQLQSVQSRRSLGIGAQRFFGQITEQGVVGLLAFLALITAFAFNMIHTVRASREFRLQAGYVAVAATLVAALASHSFNGEVIPTTFYLYVWIALSFAVTNLSVPASRMDAPQQSFADARLRRDRSFKKNNRGSRKPGRVRCLPGIAMVSASILSIGMAVHAANNWKAETSAKEAARAANEGDLGRLSASSKRAEEAMPYVGTYHLEFAALAITFLEDHRSMLAESERTQLVQAAIRSGMWAAERTEKPMMALLNLVVLGDSVGDERTNEWLQRLKTIDPYWYRPHEISALLLLRQGKVGDAFKEITLARQLAPYVESATNLWNQLHALNREIGRTTP